MNGGPYAASPGTPKPDRTGHSPPNIRCLDVRLNARVLCFISTAPIAAGTGDRPDGSRRKRIASATSRRRSRRRPAGLSMPASRCRSPTRRRGPRAPGAGTTAHQTAHETPRRRGTGLERPRPAPASAPQPDRIPRIHRAHRPGGGGRRRHRPPPASQGHAQGRAQGRTRRARGETTPRPCLVRPAGQGAVGRVASEVIGESNEAGRKEGCRPTACNARR